MFILGAGLAGCIAGILNADADILEKATKPEEIPVHKALLRFRSDKIARICGIDFEKVTVRKVISLDRKQFREPTIRLANMYSRKVSNGYYERSILNLEDSVRYIAPENFHEILLRRCRHQIRYGAQVTRVSTEKITVDGSGLLYLERNGEPVVSTLPMNINCRLLGMDCSGMTFSQSAIEVARLRIQNCNLYQTVYYPDPSFHIYRASIIKDLLIVEAIGAPVDQKLEDGSDALAIVLSDFGIGYPNDVDFADLQTFRQQGKISPVDNKKRKDLILRMTLEKNFYSLGRFSVWRNILLDDVFEDVLQIRRMLGQSSYDIRLADIKGEER